jgi:hypothetical protein
MKVLTWDQITTTLEEEEEGEFGGSQAVIS